MAAIGRDSFLFLQPYTHTLFPVFLLLFPEKESLSSYIYIIYNTTENYYNTIT